MRVWDIHPGYLSRQSLLGQHAEIHALYTVINQQRKGYAAHPETKRWQGNLNRLKFRHDLTAQEMILRQFNHRSPFNGNFHNSIKTLKYVDQPARQFAILQSKYWRNNQSGRIPLPQFDYQFWANHQYSIMARGDNCFKEIQQNIKSSSIMPIEEANELVDQVLSVMEQPIDTAALKVVIDHIWGHLNQDAVGEERTLYLKWHEQKQPVLLKLFYQMALKYHCHFLIHSTIFSELIE